MPIIDFAKTRYHWEENYNNTGVGRYVRDCTFKGLCYKKSFLRMTKIRKARDTFTCRCCDKQRSGGTRYIGATYDKVCLFCVDEWLENSSNTLKDMQSIIKNLNKNVKKHNELWRKEAIAGSI
jgi:hypothetical protein